MSKELEALQAIEAVLDVGLKDNVYFKKLDIVANINKEAVLEHIYLIREALEELECVKHNYKALEERFNNVVAYATKIQDELNELKRRTKND